MCQSPCPWQTAISVLSWAKQNHSICFFREWIAQKDHFLVGGLRTRGKPLCGKGNCLSVFLKSKESIALLCSPDQRETCPVEVQEAAGCFRRYPRAAELQGHRPRAVSLCSGPGTRASLVKKLMGLWQPQGAASVHPCTRGWALVFHAEDKAHPRRERIPVDGENTNSHSPLLVHKEKLCFAFLVSCVFLFNCFLFRSEILLINSESPWQWLAKIYEGCIRVEFLIW